MPMARMPYCIVPGEPVRPARDQTDGAHARRPTGSVEARARWPRTQWSVRYRDVETRVQLYDLASV